MILRIAVHRVWHSQWEEWRSMQVIELDTDTHRVLNVYPFTEEPRNTEWWGGLVILSTVLPLEPNGGEGFDAYIRRAGLLKEEKLAECYAFYVTGFSIADRRFLPAGRIKRI